MSKVWQAKVHKNQNCLRLEIHLRILKKKFWIQKCIWKWVADFRKWYSNTCTVQENKFLISKKNFNTFVVGTKFLINENTGFIKIN